MRGCIIPFCSTRGSIPGIRYFRITASRRESWLAAIGSTCSSTERISDQSICSKHFTDDDFHIVKGKSLLKPDAVPSLHLKPKRIDPFLQLRLKSVKMDRSTKITLKTEIKVEREDPLCMNIETVFLTPSIDSNETLQLAPTSQDPLQEQ